MERNKTLLIIGILLIVLGLVFVFDNLNIWTLESSWPSILVLVGLGFVLGYLSSRNNYGMLMPASVMILSSIPLFICSVSGHWNRMVELWPIFLLGPALGFFLMYFLGPRDRGLLLPAYILGAMGILFLFIFNYLSFFWPILFIVVGLVLIGLSVIKFKREEETILASEDSEKT